MNRHGKAIVAGLAILIALLAFGVASADENPPGVMFSTLLNGVKMDHKTGDFYLYNIQGVFLPPAESNTIYPYNPDDGGALWAMLTDSEDNEIAKFEFYAEELQAPYWLMNSYKLTDLRTGESPGSRIHLDPGEYKLDFYVEGEQFYHYPFSVDIIPSSDPFTPGDYYFLEGDWENWGYFYYPDANPEQSIYWKVWLRNKAHATSKDVKPMLEITRGDELVCTSRQYTTYNLSPEWTRYEFDLIFPMEGTSGGAYFKAKDLLAEDGAYKMTVKLDDEIYGTWDFVIEGGAFKSVGRTVRGVAEPLTFVEGGRDAFWYSR